MRYNNQSPVLTGWKEIANHLNMGVRTVQRYERERALPIRRPWKSVKGPVLAVKSDLDLWVGSMPKRQAFDAAPLPGFDRSEWDGLRTHISQSRQLRFRTLDLRNQLLGSIKALQNTIAFAQSRIENSPRQAINGLPVAQSHFARLAQAARVGEVPSPLKRVTEASVGAEA